MAAPTLSVLAHPEFPQVFPAAIDQLVTRVLTTCFWSDEHCDCHERATVHDLKSEQEFCLRHFRKVEALRG